MPLPDERPRQSVANLIGRFEKQKSSTGSSIPPIALPRTSSVASHRTDDSTQEEVKEKREWPPKSAATLVSQPIQLPPKRFSPTSLVPPVNKEKPALPDPELPSPSVVPNPVPPSPDQTHPQSTPAKANPPLPNQMVPLKAKSPPPSKIKPAAMRTTAPAKSPASKATVKANSEVSLKPHPPGDSAASSSTLLKPQHTGQSTTSSHTITRATAKPRASAPPKTPAVTTPARTRTPPSTTHPKTPSSAPRARTPLSTTRPKTPSGLYAPTAASLARSKAGAPAPPPAEKPKRKIQTDLSKPTAASASRMRSPVAAPATIAGKASIGKPTATKAVVKTPPSKVSTPAKRPVAAKPRSDQPTATADHKAKKTSSEIATAAGAATIATVAAVSTMETVESTEISQQGVTEALMPDADDVAVGEAEDIDHLTDTHEESAVEQEHIGLTEEQPSPRDEEIENYDEDFPDDVPHETLEEPGNGHVMSADTDGGPLDEDPIKQHIIGSAGSLHDDDTFPVLGGRHELEGALQELPQHASEPHDVTTQFHHPEDNVENDSVEGQLEDVVKGRKVGSDLEDIVNVLESGPQIQRAFVEVSQAGETVSEAGEIPDED